MQTFALEKNEIGYSYTYSLQHVPCIAGRNIVQDLVFRNLDINLPEGSPVSRQSLSRSVYIACVYVCKFQHI